MIDDDLDFDEEGRVQKEKFDRELDSDRDQEELRALLQDKAFRYFLWRLLSKCGTFNSEVVSDPVILGAMNGMRNVGMWIFAEIEQADPSAFEKIRAEARIREEKKYD